MADRGGPGRRDNDHDDPGRGYLRRFLGGRHDSVDFAWRVIDAVVHPVDRQAVFRSLDRFGDVPGTTAQTQYGPVQVEIVVSAGKITDVKALQVTDQGGRSVEISNYATPILRTEAISAQSANIQSVSGATFTSEGYITSLQSAINKAGL
ncbi:MAG: FMN-binding protein [Frondihabitans sp.]|nr:FMN-binding protein [Frondihabitans sp.]